MATKPNLYDLCKDYSDINICSQSENLGNAKDIWDSTLEDDGYRYVGTNPNNYICFGITDKATCIGNTDLYMYRIIGIFEDNDGNKHLKLIKKEALTYYSWHSASYEDIDWDESDLYNGLNGSYFLTNSKYSYMQDSNWLNKIVEWNYTAVNTRYLENYEETGVPGVIYDYNNPKVIYLHELNRDSKNNQECFCFMDEKADCSAGEWKTIPSKLGLMYVSDHALALGSEYLDYNVAENGEIFKTGWIEISNNVSDFNLYYQEAEWTMARGGMLDYSYNYPYLLMNGFISLEHRGASEEFYVRPVFYLRNDMTIGGGTGTIADPFIIS